MTVTAARLGSSPLALDWSGLLSAPPRPARVPGYGGPDVSAISEAWGRLRARFASGEVGFYDAPISDAISQAEACRALAEALLARDRFTDCLFLGIGGSALGPLSLLSALEERRQGGLRFHFLENPDPLDWKATLGRLRPDSTLVCSVTKSGTTFETLAQTLLAAEWLGRERLGSQLVAVTDPDKGDLRAFARARGLQSLPIVPSVGGRFSVFTPVGLFAAALSRLSVQELLQGARQARDYCEKQPLERNALLILGDALLRHSPERPIHVCMPYSTRLKSAGDWFVQLWGESLGKDGKGFTPLAAVGAVDQHSLLQLLRDGPDDKVTFFVAVDQVDDEVGIPVLPESLASFRLLGGHSLHELLRVERHATALVLTRRGRPHVTFALDRLDERGMGALYFSWAVLAAFTGALWGVDPFDQPGVEEGKGYIRESLMKPPPA